MPAVAIVSASARASLEASGAGGGKLRRGVARFGGARGVFFDAGPEDADDPVVVERIHRAVVERMQAGMDELRAAGRHGLFA